VIDCVASGARFTLDWLSPVQLTFGPLFEHDRLNVPLEPPVFFTVNEAVWPPVFACRSGVVPPFGVTAAAAGGAVTVML